MASSSANCAPTRALKLLRQCRATVPPRCWCTCSIYSGVRCKTCTYVLCSQSTSVDPDLYYVCTLAAALKTSMAEDRKCPVTGAA